MEFTCIACEFKYSQDTGDVEERMCNSCLYEIRDMYSETDAHKMQTDWLKSQQFQKIIKDIESQVECMDNKGVADVIAILNNYRIAFDIVMDSLGDSKVITQEIKEQLQQLINENVFKQERREE